LTQQDRDLASTLVPALSAAFATERDPKQRLAIATVVAEIEPLQVRPLVPTLAPWLKSEDVAFAMHAVKVLRKARADAAAVAPELLSLTQKSPSLELRIEAATALAEIDPGRARETVPVLIDIVQLIDECTGGMFETRADPSATDPSQTHLKGFELSLLETNLRDPKSQAAGRFRKLDLDPKLATVYDMEAQRREALRLVGRFDFEKAKQLDTPGVGKSRRR
jgi:hypothetical protein